MRSAIHPARWLRSERIVALQPAPKDASEAGWRRRVRAFPGRSLSHLALTAEQEQRAGRLALRGQMLSPGVVSGLGVDLDRAEKKALRVSPGTGIAASGEDVSLLRELSVVADELLVWGTRNPAVVGSADVPLGELPDRPRALVLVLRPVEILARDGADPGDPCEDDPAGDAFADHQRVDAALPVWVQLPESLAAIARDVADATARNRLAHAIFALEVDAEKRDALVRADEKAALPWEDAGVPLALVGFDAEGLVEYVDCHAVARRGGKARRRSPLLLQAGPRRLFQGAPALWQARIEQLGEHIVDLLDDNRWSPGLVYKAFSFAPPAGILPLELFHDLPEAARRQDFFPSHAVVEWMPIPLEQLDATITASAGLARIDFSKRFVVRMLLPVPENVYEPTLLVVAEPDDDLLERRDELALALTQARYLRDRLFDQSSDLHALLDGERPARPNEPGAHPIEENELAEDQRPPVPDAPDFDAAAKSFWDAVSALERDSLPKGEAGKHPLLEALKRTLDTGGMRAVRNQLLRLADRTDDVIDVGFLRIQTDIYRTRQLLLGNDKTTQMAVSPVLADVLRGSTAEAMSADVEKVFAKIARTSPKNATGAAGFPVTGTPPVVGTPAGASEAHTSAVAGAVFGVERTIHIGGRPLDAFPVLARQGATTSKYDTLGAMTKVFETAEGEGLDTVFADVTVSVPDAQSEMKALSLKELLQGDLTLEARARIEASLGQDDDKLDEALVLGRGVRTMEHAIAALRQIERKITRVRRLIALAGALIDKLTGWLGDAAASLAAAGKALAEARHDHAVALALVAEDAAEVAATNARRKKILSEHVRFVAFVRPRTEQLVAEAPGRDLESPEELPVPACFRENVGPIPPEIRQAGDLVRRAPLLWMPPFHLLLDALGDRGTLAHVVRATVTMAPLTFVAKAEPRVQAEALPIVRGLQAGFTAMEAQLGERDEKLRALDVRQVEHLPWSALRTQALDVVSFADLAHVGHLRPDILQRATLAIDGLTRVATCLYRRFAEVPADIRLAWAQKLSVFDAAIGLRDLLALPRFTELPRDDRATMQALVDWLYSQIVALPRPLAMMDNLVRVCALLASHAPVRALLRGKIGPITVSIGHLVKIKAVDVVKTRVGMNVLLAAPAGRKGSARAVVEDISDEHVTARVFATSEPSVDLPDDTDALLGEAEHIAEAAAKVLASAMK